uniref:Single-stranded DNA-binding protein n=1 Tax=Sciadococcus taiwanensis TaxID=3028030 RepID=A0A9Y1MWN5_9RHOD|nr:single-stranded DNA-binding protein [Sciadococcus taiwanensis]
MNRFILTVKIIKLSKIQVLSEGLTTCKLVVQFSNPKSPKILNYIYIKAWGNLAQELEHYYTIGDYLLIEGYLNIVKKYNTKNNKKPEVKVNKIYPLYLRKNKFKLNSKDITPFYDRIPF